MFSSRQNELSPVTFLSPRIIVFWVRVQEILKMEIIVFCATGSIYNFAFRKPLLRISFFWRSFTSGRQTLRPGLKSSPFTWLYITVWFLSRRLRQRSIERAMDLTDSFTWEDLPTRDAETGHLTAAGWIPKINLFSKSAAIVILCFHFLQSTIRIVTNHETIIIAWYPFDWTVSPFYELVNISQVTLSIN